MRDVIEFLREALASNQVKPAEIAALVVEVLPRAISFNTVNDNGYVAGNVVGWWIPETAVVLKADLPGAKALYKLDALHTVLPTTARIGIRKYDTAELLGYLRFDTDGSAMVPEFTNDVTLSAGESIEFYVESMPAVVAISVTIPHFIQLSN